jgi:hypothetical protein
MNQKGLGSFFSWPLASLLYFMPAGQNWKKSYTMPQPSSINFSSLPPFNFYFFMISKGLSRPGKRLPGSDGRVNLSLFYHPPVRAPLIKGNSSTY